MQCLKTVIITKMFKKVLIKKIMPISLLFNIVCIIKVVCSLQNVERPRDFFLNKANMSLSFSFHIFSAHKKRKQKKTQEGLAHQLKTIGLQLGMFLKNMVSCPGVMD